MDKQEKTIWYESLSSANRERNKYWDPEGEISLSFRSNELAGEVGEACNLVKKLHREQLGLPGSRTTKSEVMKELADVIICVDLLVMELGMDERRLRDYVKKVFNEKSDELNLPIKLF